MKSNLFLRRTFSFCTIFFSLKKTKNMLKRAHPDPLCYLDDTYQKQKQRILNYLFDFGNCDFEIEELRAIEEENPQLYDFILSTKLKFINDFGTSLLVLPKHILEKILYFYVSTYSLYKSQDYSTSRPPKPGEKYHDAKTIALCTTTLFCVSKQFNALAKQFIQKHFEEKLCMYSGRNSKKYGLQLTQWIVRNELAPSRIHVKKEDVPFDCVRACFVKAQPTIWFHMPGKITTGSGKHFISEYGAFIPRLKSLENVKARCIFKKWICRVDREDMPITWSPTNHHRKSFPPHFIIALFNLQKESVKKSPPVLKCKTIKLSFTKLYYVNTWTISGDVFNYVTSLYEFLRDHYAIRFLVNSIIKIAIEGKLLDENIRFVRYPPATDSKCMPLMNGKSSSTAAALRINTIVEPFNLFKLKKITITCDPNEIDPITFNRRHLHRKHSQQEQ